MGCVLGRPGSSGSVSGSNSRHKVSTRMESNRHEVNNVSVTKTESTEITTSVSIASASNGEEVKNDVAIVDHHKEENGVVVTKEKKPKGERKQSKPDPRRSNQLKNLFGEQVAAGWPSWLSEVCGEALNGWLPRKADSFEKIDKIGSGTYSNVYKAKDSLTGHIVALKKVRPDMERESLRFMAKHSKHGDLFDSVNVFKELKDKEKDVVSWNALLSGFLKNRKGQEALTVFASMCRAKIEISEFTLCSLMKICASLKILKQGKQVHAMVVVTGRDQMVLGTVIIGFYSSVGLMNEAMKVYVDEKDEVMSNSLISGCVRNWNYEEAYRIMSKEKRVINVRLLMSSLAG